MAKDRVHLLVCAGTGCVSNNSFRIKEVLESELKKYETSYPNAALVASARTGAKGRSRIGAPFGEGHVRSPASTRGRTSVNHVPRMPGAA